MIQSIFSKELELQRSGYDIVIGVDEVGRGPLAGPVVAGAVVCKFFGLAADINQSSLVGEKLSDALFGRFNLIRDSKKLSAKQREKSLEFIRENFYIGIGICDHKTVDRINILEASFLAMKKAISDLSRKLKSQISEFETQEGYKFKYMNLKTIILVDGNKKIPNFSERQLAIVGGDETVKSISAASIVSKVTRDRIMSEFHDKYSQYGFDKHKGYGTKIHTDAIKKYGHCEIHRKSFEPIKTLLSK